MGTEVGNNSMTLHIVGNSEQVNCNTKIAIVGKLFHCFKKNLVKEEKRMWYCILLCCFAFFLYRPRKIERENGQITMVLLFLSNGICQFEKNSHY